jgi:hypothetical protein
MGREQRFPLNKKTNENPRNILRFWVAIRVAFEFAWFGLTAGVGAGGGVAHIQFFAARHKNNRACHPRERRGVLC